MSVLTYEELLDSDKYYTKDEIDSNFGSSYKINFKVSLVLKSSELFEKYQKNNLLKSSVNGNEYKISEYLLIDLVEEDGMYKYVLKNMDNSLSLAARIAYIIDEDTYHSIKISRAEFASALNAIKDKLSVKGKMRLALINSLVSPFSLRQKYATTNYTCIIDEKRVIIPATYLIDLFLADEDSFSKKIQNGYFGYSKEILAYVIVDFVEKNRILQKYIFDAFIIERYNKLKKFEIVDFESLNKNLISNTINIDGEDILESITIPTFIEETKRKIKSNGYSPLEIAIYLYFEMCNFYSYDEKFFLMKKTGDEETSITTKNFIYIYAKILEELKIKFTIDQTLIYDLSSGKSKLAFKAGEFLVSVDSLDDLGKNDLTSVKINDDIIGLKSVNRVDISKIKFKELIDKMYKIFLNDKKRTLDFKSKLEEYERTYQECKLSKKERIKLFLTAIARKDLKGTDNIGYMKRVFNNIFAKDKNVSINFIGAGFSGDEFNVTPIAIVTVLENNEYCYYKVNPKSPNVIDSITKEELEGMFSNDYYYYRGFNNCIPGLEMREEYVRTY